MKSKQFLIYLFGTLLPFSILAHPGHGETGGFTITHYFSEPIHAIGWVAFLIMGILFFRKVKFQKK